MYTLELVVGETKAPLKMPDSLDSPWKDLLATTAMVSTILQFLSGMFTVQRIRRQGGPGELSHVPFLAGTVGCICWLIYGVLIGDGTIKWVNVIGTILNSFYVSVFFTYTIKKTNLSRQIMFAFMFVTSLVYYVGAVVSDESSARDQLGSLCVVITLGCCASPLIALKQVIRSRSTELLPFPLILAMFLVCGQWWIYGLLIGDGYMQFTNLCGTFIALAQLSLFVIYPSSSR